MIPVVGSKNGSSESADPLDQVVLTVQRAIAPVLYKGGLKYPDSPKALIRKAPEAMPVMASWNPP